MFNFLKNLRFNFNVGFSQPVLHSAAQQDENTNTGFKEEADARYESGDRRTVVSYSKDCYRNNSQARAFIDTMVDGVLGHGLTLNVAPSKNKLSALKINLIPKEIKTISDEIEYEWLNFSNNCDWLGMDNFNALQDKAFRTLLVDGDVFFYTTQYKGKPKIRLIEGNNIRTPENYTGASKVEDGVELDGLGRPVAYYFEQLSADGLTTNYKRLPIYNSYGEKVLFMHSLAYRPGQLRGMPFLTPVFEILVRLSELQKTELKTAQKQAHMTAVYTRQSGGTSFAGDSRVGNTSSSQAAPKGVETISIPQGAEYKMLESTHPNKQFEDFYLQLLRTCSAALGIPLEVVLKHYNSNYSASRAAIIQAYSLFSAYRQRFISAFCQPAYHLFFNHIKTKVFTNYPKNNINEVWSETRWTRPRLPHIDPQKEANALDIGIKNGTLTYKDICAANGVDLQDHIEQIKDEKELHKMFAKVSSVVAVKENEDEDEDEENAA